MTQQANIPLCVDLDGTLIRSDIMLESFVRAFKNHLYIIFLAPFWLLKGKHYLKRQLAERSEIDVENLPYDYEFLTYLKEEFGNRRELVLVTGSYKKYAEKIAEYLGIFSGVVSTDDEINLTGRNKADYLEKTYGKRNFDYAGNEAKDGHIWEISRKAIVVNADSKTIKIAKDSCEVEKIFDKKRAGLKKYLKAIRVHQWTKNALIFVPLLASHKFISNYDAIIGSVIAFVSFGFCASATYIINDLLDLDADRVNEYKRKRAFASGDISIFIGLVICTLLFIASFILLFFVPFKFSIVLAVYIITTLLYSFKLKSLAMVDVVVLAGLFTTRVVAGAAASDIQASFWLLSFSVFLFLSLALVKRASELINLRSNNKEQAKGRGYAVSDLSIVKSMGTSSGYLAVLVLALYIHSQEVTKLYENPNMLWFVCPLILFWISRIWLITARGNMHEDPIVFAIKDKGSWVIALLASIFLALANQTFICFNGAC